MNIGEFTRLKYDECAYNDNVTQSVSPLQHTMLSDKYYNCRNCFPTLNPARSAIHHSVGSAPKAMPYASNSDHVDIDSMFKNLNFKRKKCKFTGNVNPAKLEDFHVVNNPSCDELNPRFCRLVDPSFNIRGAPINRFINLPHDPQQHIYTSHAINTALEARDNYIPRIPRPWNTDFTPDYEPEPAKKCFTGCYK